MSNLVSKISTKIVCGKTKVPTERTPLMRIIGSATGIQTGESNYGEWVAFKGRFKGINLETGEEFIAGKAYLPSVATDLLQDAVVRSNGAVDFGFDIYSEPSEATIGYQYSVDPLIEAEETDPFSALESHLPKLPSPKGKKKAKAKK